MRSHRLILSLCIVIVIGCGHVTAADEHRGAWTTSKIQGTPTRGAPFRIEVVRDEAFKRPTAVVAVPDSKWLLVAEIDGRILAVPRDGSAPPRLVLNLKQARKNRATIFDLTLRPGHPGEIWITYNGPGDEPRTRASRFKLRLDSVPSIDPESELIVLRWPSGGHNGACLRFGRDGLLFISTGDGAGPNPPDRAATGQDISDLLGSILRIDVNRQDGDRAYAIPPDNPFVKTPNARPEIFAYGLRNPWKMDIDRRNNQLWVADVGWESWEMIHRIVPGGNYGWSVKEGRKNLLNGRPLGPTPILPPLLELPRSEANSVTGGVVYEGEKFPKLRGTFVYGDYVTGKIWAVSAQDGVVKNRELADTDIRIVAFAQDDDGAVYVLDHDYTQKLYRLVPNVRSTSLAAFPRQLSKTGLFSSLETMQPSAGVVPYRVVAEPWVDGASADRFVALPGRSSIEVGDAGFEFPAGSVLVRNLFLEGDNPRRIETQLLHFENNSWRPYSYAWNADQKDAELVGPAGENRLIEHAGKTLTWRYAGRSECTLCHNAPIGSVLGFDASQLNLDDQLKQLESRGVLAKSAEELTTVLPKLVDPHGTAGSIDDRARSYLHTNCGVCHNAGGDSTISIRLRRQLSLPQTRALRHPAVGTFGVSDAQIIRPGDPFGSLLLYRINKLGNARMPHVGSRVVDPRGSVLIRDWIASLRETEPSAASKANSKSLSELRERSTDEAQYASAVRQLLSSTRGALALVTSIHDGSVQLSSRIVDAGWNSPSPDISGLFATFVPESQRSQTLGYQIDPESILELVGDIARGRSIFASDGSRCRNCHPQDIEEIALGPHLGDLAKKYKREEVLTQILSPSLKIDSKYDQYLLVLKDGTVRNGLLLSKNDKTIKLRDAEKKTIEVSRKNVRRFEKQKTSLMPELLLRDMTAQQAADLLAYLMSLNNQEAK